MSLLDADQSARYIDSLVASVQALEADLAATRAKLREVTDPDKLRLAADKLPRRDVPALIEALRIRALALTGEAWERTATREMMKEAAEQLEQAQARIAALEQLIAVMENYDPRAVDDARAMLEREADARGREER